MSQQVTYTCDECGRPKEGVNHWFKVMGPIFIDDANDEMKPSIAIVPFDADDEKLDHISNRVGHVCGVECAIKKVSKVLGGAV